MTEIEELRKRLAAQIKVTELAKLEADKLREKNKDLEVEKGKLQAEIDFFEENHEDELNELRSKLEEKEAANRDQSSLVTELNKKYITLVEETSSIRTETETEKAERAKLEQKVLAYEKKMKAQAMSQTGVQRRNKDLINQNSILSNKLKTSENEVNQVKKKVDELEKELTKAQVQLEETQDTCDILINEKEQISSLFQGTVRH